jgi:hypothetical protein
MRRFANKEQENYMAGFTRFIGSVATLAVAGMLAGCAGALPNASSPQQPAGAPIAQKKMKCPGDNGVSVHPCSVKLTAQKTSAMVKTRGPKGGSFVVRDNHCASKGIVTVTGPAGNLWTITAGSGKGRCTVNFIDKELNGKKIGIATVDVENEGS